MATAGSLISCWPEEDEDPGTGIDSFFSQAFFGTPTQGCDIVSGRYKGYNGRQLTLVVAVLLYVVSPLDLIPDFLAGIGFLDDAALVSYAIRLVDKELCRYLQWKDNTVASDEETKV